MAEEKKFIILGDVHGNLNWCVELARRKKNQTIIQIGDLGVGFIPLGAFKTHLPPNFKFFVGNHDNRKESKQLSCCLGDYGDFENFFFVSGANSIDKEWRTERIDWWPDEELTYEQGTQCLEAWGNSKAQIVLSHDCPQSIAQNAFGIHDKSLTRNLLEQMFQLKQPKLWIFGHHHKPLTISIGGTEFQCLGIDHYTEI